MVDQKENSKHPQLIVNQRDDKDKPLRTWCLSRNFFDLMVLTVGFNLLFVAFGTAQGFAAPLLGDLGSISLLVLYFAFAGSGIVAPYIVKTMGPRNALIVSAATYGVYVASFIYVITPVLLIAAFANGFMGNVLWTSQGVMMAQITTNENKFKYFSLFQGIVFTQLIPGNLLSHFLLDPDDDVNGTANTDGVNATTTTTIAPEDPLKNMAVGWSDEYSVFFVVLTVICFIGVATFALWQPPDQQFGSAPVVDESTLSQQIKRTTALLKTKKMASLIIFFVYSGIEVVLWASWFPRQMYKTKIGLVLPVIGAAELMGCFAIGPALDRYGNLLGIGIILVTFVASALSMWFANEQLMDFCEANAPEEAMPCKSFQDYSLFFVTAIFFGLHDVTVMSVIGSICSKSFGDSVVDVFALRWTFLGIGATFGFAMSTPLSIEGGKTANREQVQIMLAMTGAVLVLSMIGLRYFMVKYDNASVMQPAQTDVAKRSNDSSSSKARSPQRSLDQGNRGSAPNDCEYITNLTEV